jgi:molybdate transport system ATP-binding protein
MLEFDVRWQRGDFLLTAAARMEHGATGLCGASGAGKSTLLALIAGLQKPDSGRIVLDDRVLVDTAKKIFRAPEQRHIGLVFQDAQLFPHLSVASNLLYGFRRLTPAARHFTLHDIVELLEIGHLLARRPRFLSGGEKQRVALGRALLYSPRLLLLDEPLASLDETRKQQILPFLLRIRDDLKMPMLYVSHIQQEVDYLAEVVWRCQEGRLMAPGSFVK